MMKNERIKNLIMHSEAQILIVVPFLCQHGGYYFHKFSEHHNRVAKQCPAAWLISNILWPSFIGERANRISIPIAYPVFILLSSFRHMHHSSICHESAV